MKSNPFWSGLLPLLVVLFIGIIVSTGLYGLTSQFEFLNKKDTFRTEASRKVNNFSRLLNDYLQALQTVRSFFRASQSVTREEFKTFVGQPVERNPGVRGLYWFSHDFVNQGNNNSGSGTVYGRQISGFELKLENLSHSNRFKREFQKVVDTRSPTFIPAGRWVNKKAKKGLGQVLVLFPQGYQSKNGEQSGQKGILGEMIYLPELARQALEKDSRDWVDLILKLPTMNAPAYYRINRNNISLSREKSVSSSPLRYSRDVSFAGQTMNINVIPTKQFHRAQSRWWTEVALAFSLFLTLVAGLYVWLLNRQKTKVKEQVKKRTRELEEAKQQAEEANRVKSDFLAKMSHELRTPLTTILGYQELVTDELDKRDLDNSIRDDMGVIRDAGEHLLELINEILDLSKIEAGKMDVEVEEFSVKELLHDIAGTIQPLVERNNNELIVDVEEMDPSIVTDKTKLRQCLYNLLSNASKFTENGTIRLSVEEVESGIQFSVSDTGQGIPEDDQDDLFEAFEQGDGSRTDGEGTGLGMTITKRFVEMMGGHIEFESTVGEGTELWIRLPETFEEDLFAGSPEASDEEPIKPSGPTVLVIEDDEDDRIFIEQILEEEGFRILSAGAGRKGLKLAEKEQPDVITLDVVMPEMDGWKVLRQLKGNQATRDIPVILVTVTEDVELADSLGASDFIMKPINRESLLESIHSFKPEPENETVLIVEDNPNTRDRLQRMLRDEPWSTLEVSNGREAMDVMEETVPEVILLDLMMPKMNGFEFLEEIRSRGEWKFIPVIVLTNKDLTPEEKDNLDKYVHSIVKKGETHAEFLVDDVKRLIKTGSEQTS